MWTTIEIPEPLLAEAIKHADATTGSEAVFQALEELSKRHRIAGLVRHLGTFDAFMTSAELEAMRSLE